MLEAKGLSAGYGERQVIRELSLELRRGELMALLGPNGSGKSTLLSALCGVLPRFSGEVLLENRPIGGIDRRSLSREISYVPQQSAFVQGFTVEEIVLMGRSCWLGTFERPGERDLALVESAIGTMELQEVRSKSVLEISGGEAQRACLARALAQDTPVALFDEPTSSLDPRHALLVMQRLSSMAGEGRAVAVALHDVNLALRYAGRMAFLKEGRLLGIRTPSEVEESILESVFDVGWSFAGASPGSRLAFPV